MLDTKFTDDIRPRWWLRVRPDKVRRLYELAAQGLTDEDLLNDVGMTLLLRCRSILIATEAHEGRAKCPRCGALIPHNWDKEAVITCTGCGWQTTWGAYLRTYQDKHLHGGGALFAFQAYTEDYEQAQTPQERLLLIDQLLHAFHWELTQLYSRPAACNLIEGKIGEVVALLDGLTYGDQSRPELKRAHAEWCEKVDKSGEWMQGILARSRMRQQQPHTGD